MRNYREEWAEGEIEARGLLDVIDDLRAKIAEMEKQEPVAWAATDETKTVVEALGMNQSRRFDSPLFLAPGAQPTPSTEYMGWYCAHCERGVDASEVTYHEQHQVCGRIITDDKPPKPAPSVPEKIERVESGFKGMFLREAQAYKQGWNECRAAMLAAAPETQGEEK